MGTGMHRAEDCRCSRIPHLLIVNVRKRCDSIAYSSQVLNPDFAHI